jgi:replication factor A1
MTSFLPISELSSYRSGWTIKAKVMRRAPTRSFNTNGKQGKVFDCELVDLKGTEIKASWFNEAAEKFNFLTEGKVYTFHRGQVKVANKRYNQLKHQYELNFNADAVIAEVAEEAAFENIQHTYTFTELRELRSKVLPCTVDLCVMVKEQSPIRELPPKADSNPSEILRQAQEPRYLHKFICVDASEHSLEVAVFGEKREEDFKGKCLVVKRCGIKEYQGGRGGATDWKNVMLDPELPQVAQLRAWWTASGESVAVQSLSMSGALGSAGTATDGSFVEMDEAAKPLQVDQSIYWRTQAYLSRVRTEKKDGQKLDLTYDACPLSQCNNKKVMNNSCEKCGKTVQPNKRFLLTSLQFEDEYSTKWANAFDEAGKVLLKMSAADLDNIKQSPELTTKLQPLQYGTLFTLRLKTRIESYEGQPRQKTSVIGVEPVSAAEAGQKALQTLQGLYGGLSPDQQAAVKELLAGPTSLREVNGGHSFPASWNEDFARLQAIAA